MRSRLICGLLMAAAFFTGVAYLCVLPPFEAFDEAFYWSGLQQFADTGVVPRLGVARIARDAALYPGPRPSEDGQPYQAFDRSGARLGSGGPTVYGPGAAPNYQAQHPPLFDAVMTLPYHWTSGLTWRWHMLALRLACWSMAFAGFALGALTTRSLVRPGAAWLPLCWPFLFPEFFPEFTRITPDTLCLLLAGVLWRLLASWLDRGPSRGRSVGLGVVLGLGLLAKAFFLPVTAGVTLLLLAVSWRRGQGAWPLVVLLALIAVAIGSPWYVSSYLLLGDATGAGDFVALEQQGGLLAGLRAHFSVVTYAYGLMRIVMGFCWAGTWSFVHLARWTIVPVAALALVPLARYAATLHRRPIEASAPVFVAGPVIGGLVYHELAMVAQGWDIGGTGGWYLHIFAGPLSLALVLGWPASRWMRVLAAYAAGYGALMVWMQAAFFSGCLNRAGRGVVSLTDAACGVDFGALRMLAFPDAAVAAGGAAIVLLLVALIRGNNEAAPWERHGLTRKG